jgi:hypothetical protein
MGAGKSACLARHFTTVSRLTPARSAISAWGTRSSGSDVGHVVPAASGGLLTTAVRVAAEHLDRLHETHRIDLETKQLVIRDDANGP